MAALVAAIHALRRDETWMRGTSPRMTVSTLSGNALAIISIASALSVRGHSPRVTPHVWNNDNDVETLFAVLNENPTPAVTASSGTYRRRILI
jgi:hypothetical protein